MAEKCPLRNNTLYWDGGMRNTIPSACYESCEGLWEQAAQKAPESIDRFPHSIQEEHPNADLEYGSMALQIGEGAVRLYDITSNCAECGDEDSAERYAFICPNSQD